MLRDIEHGQTLYASMAPDTSLSSYTETTTPYRECLPLDYVAIRGEEVWACTGRRISYDAGTALNDQTISFAYTNTGPIYSLIYYALPSEALVAGTVSVKVLPLLMYSEFAFRTGPAVTTLWDSARNGPTDTATLQSAIQQGARLSIFAELEDGLQLRLPVNIPYLRTETNGFELRTMAELLPGFFEHPGDLIDTLKTAHPDILSTTQMASRSLGINASCLYTFFEFGSAGTYRPLIDSRTSEPALYKRLVVFGTDY